MKAESIGDLILYLPVKHVKYANYINNLQLLSQKGQS